MKKPYFIIPIMLCILLSACGNDSDKAETDKGDNTMYEQITAEEAKLQLWLL